MLYDTDDVFQARSTGNSIKHLDGAFGAIRLSVAAFAVDFVVFLAQTHVVRIQAGVAKFAAPARLVVAHPVGTANGFFGVIHTFATSRTASLCNINNRARDIRGSRRSAYG